MNRLRWISMVAVAVLLAGSFAFAQGQGGGRRGSAPGGPGFAGPGPGMAAAGVDFRGVDLSDTQKDQIKQIVERYRQQERTEILQVLTAEQQEKVKSNEAQRAARMKQRLNQLQQRKSQ